MAVTLNVLITGVGRGLGRAMIAEFAARRHIVVGCTRSREAIKELAKQFPAPHRFDAVDVTDEPAVARWARSVIDENGPPDLLLNNAALVNVNARLWEVPVDEFSRVIDTNIKGVFHVLRHFVPAMVASRKGVIVNFSSGWGRSTSPEVAPYCATKYAVEGMTQALAQELPKGMAAVALNPGVINTDMLKSCFGDSADSYPEPDEWAKRAVPYLLGLGSYHNGKPLSVPD